jgi:hypothetical protein
MARRILSAALLLLLCTPVSSLAVLYTCAMDGLTRMAECDEHEEVRTRSAHHGGAHGGCEQATNVPDACCEIHVVSAAYDATSVPADGSTVLRVVALRPADGADLAPRSAARRIEAPVWRSPPVYERLHSYLI